MQTLTERVSDAERLTATAAATAARIKEELTALNDAWQEAQHALYVANSKKETDWRYAGERIQAAWRNLTEVVDAVK